MKLFRNLLCCLIFIVLISGCATTLSDKTKLDKSLEHYYSGLAYEEIDKYSDAIKEYEASNELSPRPIVNYRLGVIYEKQGELDKAIQSYEKAIELSSSYADAYYSLAFAYARKGWRAKALTAWKRFRKEVGYGYRMDSKKIEEKKNELLKELERH